MTTNPEGRSTPDRDATEADLERVRMALAEVWPVDRTVIEEQVVLYDNPDRRTVSMYGLVPRDLFWRANQIAGLHGCCCACFVGDTRRWDCLAFGQPFAQDCGADRSLALAASSRGEQT